MTKHELRSPVGHVADEHTEELENLTRIFSVPKDTLKAITTTFTSELKKGLTSEGGSIPMFPTWVCNTPTGKETGRYLGVDLGRTIKGYNLRVCEVEFLEELGDFDITQSSYRIPESVKSGDSDKLWDFVATCLYMFLDSQQEIGKLDKIHLGFTFSFPVAQDYINEGILQKWLRGFDVKGVEGNDVVPLLENALKKKGMPIKVVALINDSVGTLIASAYTNRQVKVGCIFGTGSSAAYFEKCGAVKKLAHKKLDPDMPMALNCQWGEFKHDVLPRNKYDITVDKTSSCPGEQTFEKLIAGLYIPEIFRTVLLDLHANPKVKLFAGQNVDKLKTPYILDAPFMNAIEADPFDNLFETEDVFRRHVSIAPSHTELWLVRRVAELIGSRAARLSACGLAALCIETDTTSCCVGADGSMFNRYPHFRARCADALGEIFDWSAEDRKSNPIKLVLAEDGNGVGAALIAAMTVNRVQDKNVAGVKDPASLL